LPFLIDLASESHLLTYYNAASWHADILYPNDLNDIVVSKSRRALIFNAQSSSERKLP